SVSLRRRTTALGSSFEKNSRAASLISRCVSFSSKFMTSVALWQSEDVLRDDVPLDFGGARFDRVAARAQVRIRELLVDVRVRAEQLLRDDLESLVRFAPADLQNGSFRPGLSCLHDAADRAKVCQPDDFVVDVRRGDLLPRDGIIDAPLAARRHETIDLPPRLDLKDDAERR